MAGSRQLQFCMRVKLASTIKRRGQMSQTKLNPETNKIYSIKKHTLLMLKWGEGIFQVDFKNYNCNAGKAVFLNPGQYFQLVSGNFEIYNIEFPGEVIKQTGNSRFLFNHIVGLGYIKLNGANNFAANNFDCSDNKNLSGLLYKSINEWKKQNPFNTSAEETNLLFDLKEIIDEKFYELIGLKEISESLKENQYKLNNVVKERINNTVNQLVNKKLLLEAQRKVVFTNLSTKEIAYNLGFHDPAYFNRFFKKQTGNTPYEFRENYNVERQDTVIKDLLMLIDNHYKEQKFANFYAGRLNLTAKTLSKKINRQLGTTLKDLIKNKIINDAENMLRQDIPVIDIAFELGFSEANHFSAFYKLNTNQTPTEYQHSFKKSNH